MTDFEDCPETVFAEGVLTRELTIQNKKGLHARATAKFVQTAGQFGAAITVTRCGETVGGTSIMGILTLGAGIGSTIIVGASGDDAEKALDAIATLVSDKFGEGE
jgi:phosphocarrier protein HPr